MRSYARTLALLLTLPPLLAALLGGRANAAPESYEGLPGHVVQVIGTVGEVWGRDARIPAFHAHLKERFGGVPELDAFVESEQWITVITKRRVGSGLIYARSAKSIGVAKGDIVRVATADYRLVSNYANLSSVTEVLCARSAADYLACASRNPRAWFARDGSEVPQ